MLDLFQKCLMADNTKSYKTLHLVIIGIIIIGNCKRKHFIESLTNNYICQDCSFIFDTVCGNKYYNLFDICYICFNLGKGSEEKKSGKSVVFCQTRGGGISKGKQKTKPQVWKCVFSVSIENHSGTPKTCFTLGLECLGHF